ncbi:MAG: hypothetical protein ABEH88_13215 [Halobacteriales archaeon]
MPEPVQLTPDALASLLADLEDRGFVAFVADLYERTGHETEQRGNLVTTVAPGSDRERLLVWTDDRTRIERLFGTDPPDPDTEEIDAVVSRERDATTAAAIAEEVDADHLGTAALHDRLLYAMDRETCRDLCQDHFGRAVEPRPPPSEKSESTALSGLSREQIALAGLVVCSLIVVGASGLPGVVVPDGNAVVPEEGPGAVDPPEAGPVTPVGGGQGATPTLTPSSTPTPTPSSTSTNRTPVVTSTPQGILPPTVANATVFDLEDGDGVVSDGDRVAVSASVTDDDSDLVRVFAAPEQFGVNEVELTNTGGDRYTGTFVVGDNFRAVDGNWRIPIIARDTTGNVADVLTGPLAVNRSGEEPVDETSPTITNATAIDLEDGDGVVSDGDLVAVRASVTDNVSGVMRADAFPESFGVGGPLPIMDADGDGVYNTTFRVNADQADDDGRYTIGIGAIDEAENVNFRQVFTNRLELRTIPNRTVTTER